MSIEEREDKEMEELEGMEIGKKWKREEVGQLQIKFKYLKHLSTDTCSRTHTQTERQTDRGRERVLI